MSALRTLVTVLTLASTLVAGSLVAGTAATSTATTSTATSSTPVAATGPDRPAPGQLLGSTVITDRPEVDIAHGGAVHRIRYRTRGVGGRLQPALATVYLPADRPTGPLRVLAHTHGTSGVGRDCTVGLSMGRNGRNDPWLGPWLKAGYAVVVPEYTGIGTTGRHPYSNGRATARSVVDAVRAARRLPGAKLGKRFVTWGGSQGGHTALWVNRIAGDYAPGLRLVGSVGASVAARTQDYFNLVSPALPHVPGTEDMVAYFGYVLAGMKNSGVDLKAFPELSAAGRAWVRRAQQECYRDLTGHQVAAGSLVTKPLAGTPLIDAIAKHARLPGKLPAPTLVLYGAFDFVTPAAPMRAYVRAQRAGGAQIETRTYPTGHGLDATSATDALAWADGLAWPGA